MRKYQSRAANVLFIPAVVGIMLMGCGLGGQPNGLPSTVLVTLPDGTQVDATQGAGVITLADSTWDFYRTASNAQSTAFMRVAFGSEGELTRFENNTIASEIFGETLIFDGARHNTTQAGLQYAAATFGAETSDSTGFAFVGQLIAFAAGFQAAEAEATASAEFDPDVPDTIRGMFTFMSVVTLLDVPEGNQSDEFNFIGRRVTTE